MSTSLADDVPVTHHPSRMAAPLVFKGVYVTLAKNDILKDVSGVARKGQILAIMGPSGAGKSTLLNALTGRVPPTKGSITLNGETVNRSLRRKISYVQQHDVFHANLTLHETLSFAAMLRLPDEMPVNTKLDLISELVDGLELTECIHTEMGRLSGGERKCASIACEMITNPSFLLLDEPTSGLDSAIANSLMTTLTKYVQRSSKTVVTTIHQPSSQVFHMFSDLLLLFNGEVAYFGPGNQVTSFFAKIDLPCDPQYNPADFMLEQVKAGQETVDRILKAAYELREGEEWPLELAENYQAQLDTMSSARQLTELDTSGDKLQRSPPSSSSSSPPGAPTWPTGYRTQYMELTKRSFRRSRDRYLSFSVIAQVIFVSTFAGLEWFKIGFSEETARDKLGALYFSCSFLAFFPMLFSAFSVIDDTGVFMRERSAGMYRLSAYYLATVTTEMPVIIFIVTGFMTVLYWMIGLTPKAVNFIIYVIIQLLHAFTAQSIGMMLGTAIRNRTVVVTVIQCFFLASLLAGGFYNTHVHKWFVWIRYLSFITYSYSAFVVVEYKMGNELKCSPPESTIFPNPCALNDTTLFPGSLILENEHLAVFPIYASVLILLGVTIICRVVTYYVLRYHRRPKA